MNADSVEKEFLEILRKTCRTMRSNRARADMAIPAARWEMKIDERIAELEKGETPELALAGNGQKEAA